MASEKKIEGLISDSHIVLVNKSVVPKEKKKCFSPQFTMSVSLDPMEELYHLWQGG